jgi:response regulator RpfG family c-di-GMP phosphodiesterase
MDTAPYRRAEPDPDELVVFADEEQAQPRADDDPWQVLIVDDDEEIHLLTRHLLAPVRFMRRPVHFLSAYSAAEAAARLRDNPEVAVILLDVVMETEDAGLQLVRTIREELGNRRVRIVLRTGRSDRAPELQVLARYDINDYKPKFGLDAAALEATLLRSLRDYRDIRAADRSREGMQTILESAGALFTHDHDGALGEQVLHDLVTMLSAAAGSRGLRGLLASEVDGSFRVRGHRRWDDDMVGKPVAAVLPATAARMLPRILGDGRGVFCPGGFVDVLAAPGVPRHLIYVGWDRLEGESERDLVRVFMANAALAFRNLALRREVIETQKEIIHTLGEVVETRSSETANHVLRVGQLAALLGRLYGLPPADVETLRTVAPMHDVGKVGIPDAILNKPGKLTADERRVIETHTSIGHSILARSERRVMREAAVVAQQHHERWDGQGYPAGLQGEQIHPFARITALADVFDALLQPRSYRPALALDEVRRMITKESGRAFEPRLVDLLLEHLPDFVAVRAAHPDPDTAQSSFSASADSAASEA